MLVERRFDTGEVLLNYAEGPDNGPPILFISGGWGMWQDFKAVYPSLIDNYHIYALEQRGRGKSSRTKGQYQLKHMSTDTSKFIEKIIKKPTVVVGHSEGGWIGIYAAQLNPEHVNGLVVLDSPLDIETFTNHMSTEEMKTTYRSYKSMVGRPVYELFNELREMEPDRDLDSVRYSALLRSLVDPDWLTLWSEGRLDEYFEGLDVYGFLKSTDIPILFVQADPEVGGMVSDSEVSSIPKASRFNHHKIKGADHNLNLDPFDEPLIIEPILDFLSSL